jgi:hypothetical protein
VSRNFRDLNLLELQGPIKARNGKAGLILYLIKKHYLEEILGIVYLKNEKIKLIAYT